MGSQPDTQLSESFKEKLIAAMVEVFDFSQTLDDELLRIMGYQQGAFALGYVGDQQDPLAVLRGTDAKVRVVGESSDANDSFREFVAEMPDG